MPPNAITPTNIAHFILPNSLTAPMNRVSRIIGDTGKTLGRALRADAGISSRMKGSTVWEVLHDEDWYNFDWSLHDIDENAEEIIWLFGNWSGGNQDLQYYALGIVDIFLVPTLQLYRCDAIGSPVTYTKIGTAGSTTIVLDRTYRIAVDATGAAGSNYPIVIWLYTSGAWVKEIDFGGDAAIDGIVRCVINQVNEVTGKDGTNVEVDHGAYIAHDDTNVEADDHIDPTWTVANWPVNAGVTGLDAWTHAGKDERYMSMAAQHAADKDWSKVYLFDGAAVTYTDKTTDMNDEAISVTFFNADSDTDGDFVYVGYSSPFNGIFVRTVQSNTNASYRAKYWDGSAWTSVNLLDSTAGNRQDGYFAINEAAVPTDWTAADLSGLGGAGSPPSTASLYWLRLDCLSASGISIAKTFAPLESISQTANDVKQAFAFAPLTSGKTPHYVQLVLEEHGAAPDRLEVCSLNGGSVITTGTAIFGGAVPVLYDLGSTLDGVTITEDIFNDMQIKFWDSAGADVIAARTVIAYVFADNLSKPTVTTGNSDEADVCVAISTFTPRVMVY